MACLFYGFDAGFAGCGTSEAVLPYTRYLKHFCDNSLPQMHLVARSAFDRLVALQLGV